MWARAGKVKHFVCITLNSGRRLYQYNEDDFSTNLEIESSLHSIDIIYDYDCIVHRPQ